MVDNEDGGVPLVFMLSCITIVVTLSCITFVAERQKIINREATEFYSKSITQEEINEAWQKYQQRQLEPIPLTKEKQIKDSIDK